MAENRQKSGKRKAKGKPKGSKGKRPKARKPRKRAAEQRAANAEAETAEKLAKAIDEATERAQESMSAYAELAKDAASQLTGENPSDPSAWVQFTARSYAQASTDTARALITYNDMLRILADQPGRNPDG